MDNTERIPPQSPDFERSVLGTLITLPSLISSYMENLPDTAFYEARNRKIYNTLVLMDKKEKTIDIMTLSEELKSNNQLEEIGGDEYLIELSETIVSSSNIHQHIKILIEKDILRSAITECSEISSIAFNENVLPEELLLRFEKIQSKIEKKCDLVNIKRKRNGTVNRFSQFSDRIRKYKDEGFQNIGVSPGIQWKKLTELYRPAKGMLNIFTGVPGHGKSEFVDALMVNLALEKGWKWSIFTPENYPVELYAQKLCEKVFGKRFFEFTADELDSAIAFIDDHFFLIEPDEDNIEVDPILKLFGESIEKNGVDGCVLDPWNEMKTVPQGNETLTAYIGRKLGKIRRFARTHNILQIIVAHPTKVYRNPKTKKYEVPRLYDISDCYSDDTEVLTSTGWLRHKDINENSEVACFDLKTNDISWNKPLRIISQYYNGSMINFKGYGYDIFVSPNHRMVLKPSWKDPVGTQVKTGIGRPTKWPKNKWVFERAKNILNKNLILPKAGNPIKGLKIDHFKIGNKKYKTNEFFEFVGWWVAEGTFISSGASICQAENNSDRLDYLLSVLNIETTKKKQIDKRGYLPINTWYIGAKKNKALVLWLEGQCGRGAKNKKIPTILFKLHEEHKRSFLHGYILGDGHYNKNKTSSSVTTSKQLFDDLQHLAVLLGIPVCGHKRKSKNIKHNDIYQTNFGSNNKRQVAVRGSRNISITEYSGNIYCLTVPTGAYITRRNFKVSISGNSANWFNKADNGITVYRNFDTKLTDIHIQKIKFKVHGKVGCVSFTYDNTCGRYYEFDETAFNNESESPQQDLWYQK